VTGGARDGAWDASGTLVRRIVLPNCEWGLHRGPARSKVAHVGAMIGLDDLRPTLLVLGKAIRGPKAGMAGGAAGCAGGVACHWSCFFGERAMAIGRATPLCRGVGDPRRSELFAGVAKRCCYEYLYLYGATVQ
jgi:hypothetical protein